MTVVMTILTAMVVADSGEDGGEDAASCRERRRCDEGMAGLGADPGSWQMLRKLCPLLRLLLILLLISP